MPTEVHPRSIVRAKIRTSSPGRYVAAPELPDAEPEPEAPARTKRGKGKPPVPAWEDVLLGVRSSGER